MCRLWSAGSLPCLASGTLPGAPLMLAVPVLCDPDPLADRHPLVATTSGFHLVHLVDVDLGRTGGDRVARGGVVVVGRQASWGEQVVVARIVIVPSSSSSTVTLRLPGRHRLRLDLEVAWTCCWGRSRARDGEMWDVMIWMLESWTPLLQRQAQIGEVATLKGRLRVGAIVKRL